LSERSFLTTTAKRGFFPAYNFNWYQSKSDFFDALNKAEILPKANKLIFIKYSHWDMVNTSFMPFDSWGLNMKHKTETDKLIAMMLTATFGQALNSREKHLFRESLHSLVRLAKAEQMLEIRNNVEKLTGVISSFPQKGKKTSVSEASIKISQQQFEFIQGDACDSGNRLKNP
jgi:hypothetical protein